MAAPQNRDTGMEINHNNLKGLHETLKENGYNPPDYDTFVSDMRDEQNLRGAYETLKREGYTPPEFEVFKADMFGGPAFRNISFWDNADKGKGAGQASGSTGRVSSPTPARKISSPTPAARRATSAKRAAPPAPAARRIAGGKAGAFIKDVTSALFGETPSKPMTKAQMAAGLQQARMESDARFSAMRQGQRDSMRVIESSGPMAYRKRRLRQRGGGSGTRRAVKEHLEGGLPVESSRRVYDPATDRFRDTYLRADGGETFDSRESARDSKTVNSHVNAQVEQERIRRMYEQTLPGIVADVSADARAAAEGDMSRSMNSAGFSTAMALSDKYGNPMSAIGNSAKKEHYDMEKLVPQVISRLTPGQWELLVRGEKERTRAAYEQKRSELAALEKELASDNGMIPHAAYRKQKKAETLRAEVAYWGRLLNDRSYHENRVRWMIEEGVMGDFTQHSTPKSGLEFFGRKVLDTAMWAEKLGTPANVMDQARGIAMSEAAQKHPVLNVAGMIAGMGLDPMNYAFMGTGSLLGKGALWGVGSLASRGGATGAVATRVGGGTLAGKAIGSAVSSWATLAQYEAGQEVAAQAVYDDWDLGKVLNSGVRGGLLGAAMGVAAPLVGNVSTRLVENTASTAGKVAVRTGQAVVSPVLEGTIFSVPEWIEGKQDAFDVWTGNMGMVLGFKAAHMVKSAPRHIASLKNDGSGLSFQERLVRNLTTVPRDISMSREELEELRRAGYGKLADLFRRSDTKVQVQDAEGNWADSGMAEHGNIKHGPERVDEVPVYNSKGQKIGTRKEAVRDVEGFEATPEFDGYDNMVRLTEDSRVSEAARAKAYYLLTGRMLPMSTILSYRTIERDGGVDVQSLNAQGGVVTSRHFSSKEKAQGEINNLYRQIELNTIDVGERFKSNALVEEATDAACKDVAAAHGGSWTAEGVRSAYDQAVKDLADPQKAKEVGEASRKLVEEVDAAVKAHADDYKDKTAEALRSSIGKEYEVDIDTAIRKSPSKRSEQEQTAINRYAESLFPEEMRQRYAEQGQAEGEAPGEGRSAAQEARQAGYSMTEPEQREQAVRNFRYHESRMYDLFGRRDLEEMLEEEFGTSDADAILGLLPQSAHDARERGVIADYLKARETSDSAIRRVEDESRAQMEKMEAFIEKAAHKDGQVRPATMKDDGRQVYVVKGKATLTEDGSMINTAASDKVIYIYDPATDKVEQTSPSQLAGLGAATSVEETRAEMERVIIEKFDADMSALRGERDTFSPGDTFVADLWGESPQQSKVAGVDAEGKILIETEGKKGQRAFEPGELSAKIDEQKQAEFEAAMREREAEAAKKAQEPAGAPGEPAEEGVTEEPEASEPRPVRYDRGDSFRVSVGGREETQQAAVVDREGETVTIWTPFPVTDKSEKGRTMAGYTTDIARADLDAIVARDEQGKPVDYVAANPEAEPEAAPAETPAGPEEAVIREGITGTADALKESFTVERERIGNEWLDTRAVQDAMRTYADGASTVEEIVERAKADSNDERTRQRLDTLLEFDSTRQKLQAMLTVPKTGETVPTSAGMPQNPTGTPVSGAESVPESASPVENVQETLAPTAEPTPLQRIPRDAKGEPIFEQAESPEVGWDALVEFSEGDAATAKEIADTMADEKRKAYEKAQKQKPKGKTPTEILASKKAISAGLAQAEQEYNLWQHMANVEQRRQDAIRSQQEAEARQRAAERAEAEKAERAAREEAERLEREALEGIPEWHLDTPENARKRGARRFGGQMFTRQEPVQGIVGKEVEVKFSQKDLPKGHLAVIEAPQLQPSHIQGQRNPMFFIEEAQPKNRAEAVSMFAAKEMAEGIRPQEITGSATAYTGAPTVNTRGEVIQGNNRSDALRYLWDSKLPEQQQIYKQYLIDNAEQFGLDPEAVNAMQQPVLVNMLDVDDAEAIRLGQMTAQDTESGGVERIKPKNVAQKLGEDMRSFASLLLRSGDEEASFGQLVDRNGTEVMKWLAQKGAVSDTQYQSAFDSKGNLTAEAKNDLQKVLYQAVFKGGSQQLEEMFDALPAKAQRAILSTAFRDMDSPFAGKMLPEIQASIAAFNQLMNDPTFAAAKKLEEALRAVEAFKMSIQLDDRFEQYMPADNFSNFALHLAAMYKANDMSQSTLASYFNQMYDLAQGKKAATLFEEADTTEYPLADVIKQVLNIDYKPAKNGNNNVANGGADVALRNQDGQGGKLRGNEPPAIGEQNSTGTEPSDRGAGTSDDSRGGRIDKRGGESEAEASQTKLSKEDATDIIAKMEMSAVNDPQISLSPESWQNSFGLSNSIDTPLGKVKMGEGQYQKLVDKKRSAEFGMVMQTLQDPDVVFIEPSEAKEGQATERDFSYVFVKTFIRDGQKLKYYTSVSVLKDGMEVSVSSHIASKTAIMKKLQGMERAYTKQSLLPNSSEWHLAEHPTDVPDLLPTQGKSDANVETSAKTEPQQPNNAVSSDSSLSTDEQSGTSSIEPNGESTVSDRKVNNSATEKQGSGQESSVQPSDNKEEQTVQTAVAAAEAEVNTEPSEAQKKAGNYKMGHLEIDGLGITIENPKGSVRRGKDADGIPWETQMKNTYGYIKGTTGVDGDKIDVFLSDNPADGDVYVVDQYNQDGSFDEHKVMYGFTSATEAEAAYLSNYSADWAQGRKTVVTGVTREEFKKWLDASDRKTKPFAEYKSMKPVEKQNPRLAIEPDGSSDFGPVFTQFKGNAQGAIKALSELQDGEAIGALHHKDVGDIDLVWGNAGTAKSDGFGLAKLVKYHPEVLEHLQENLDDTHIVKRSENRINLESDTHKAAVRLTWNKEKKKWLLTAFEKKETPKSIDKTTDTGDNPTDLRGDTALSQNSGVSERKVNALPSEKQGDGAKSPVGELPGPSSDRPVVVKGARWEATGEPERWKTGHGKGRAKGDSHDINWPNLGEGKRRQVGSTTAERDAIMALIEDYGSAEALWNAFEDGKVFLGKNEAAILKRIIEKHEAGSRYGTIPFHQGVEADGNRDVYEAGKSLVEAAGIEVVEVSGEEVREMLGQKNTPVAGQPNRANEKPTSGSVLLSAKGDSSSNPNVPSEAGAKIINNTHTAKSNIKKFSNNDFIINTSTLSETFRGLGKLLKLETKGGSRYTILQTDGGHTVAIRLSDHAANGNNFARDNAEGNLSIVIERRRFEAKDSEIEFTEATIPLERFESRPDDVIKAIVSGVSDVLADKPFTLDSTLGVVETKGSGGAAPAPMRTEDGVVYGWTKGGKVYLNRDAMNPQTPAHEYTHLWDDMVRRENPELWERGKELMRQTPLWDEVRDDPNYADIRDNEDAVASEVHSRLTGQRGAERIEEMMKQAAAEPDVVEKAKKFNLVHQLKAWLSEMFQGLKKTLGKWSKQDLRELTAEDFADMTLRDLAEGLDPQAEITRGENARAAMRANPMLDDYHTGIRGREDAKTFDEILREAEESWTEYGSLTYPDMDIDMLREAKESGHITVYSSKPIEAGTFVTPSRMNAEDYAGGGHVYSAVVPVDRIAWISEDEGQMGDVAASPSAGKSDGRHDVSGDGIRLSAAMSRGREDFDSLRERAVAERGIVMPGLNEKAVRVVEVPRHDFKGDTPIAQAKKWAKGNIVGEHTLTDSEGKDVSYTISGKAVDKYLSQSATGKSENLGVHLSVLKKLPDVIGESVEAEVHPDYNKGEDGVRRPENGYNNSNLVHRFYGLVTVEGEPYRVKTTIIESGTNDIKTKPHSFEVTNIELLSEDSSSTVEPTATGYQGQLPHGTAKLLKGVEKSYDSGKKLLEESEKEPEYRTAEEGVEYFNARSIQPWAGPLERLRFKREREGSLTGGEREHMQELAAQEKAWEEAWAAGHTDTDVPAEHRSRFEYYAESYGQGGLSSDLYHAGREAGPLYDEAGALVSANAREMARRALPAIMRRRADLLAEREGFSRAGQAAIDAELADLEYMALYYQRMEAGEDVKRTMPGRVEHQRMLATAREVAASLGEKVVLYEAPGDIHDSDRSRQLRKRRSYGWYNPNDGTIHVNVGRHRSAGEIVKTVLHEIVGHKTIEQIMGPERFARLIDEIWNHAGKKVRAKIAEKMGKNGWDYREATKEYLGEIAEEVHTKGFETLEDEKKTVWQRVKAKIQDFLNRILEGLKIPARIRLTENDLSYMMWKLYKHKERKAAGKSAEGDIFDKAEEIARREQWEREGDSLEIAARYGEADETAAENLAHGVDSLRRIALGEDEVEDAMHRNDLSQFSASTGITFVFGKTGDPARNYKGGFGLAHIGAKHGADTILRVLDAIANGKISRYVAGNRTVIIEKDGYEALLALTRFGNKETWLFNGWDKIETTGEDGKVSTNTVSTQANPTFSREDLGAVVDDANLREFFESAKKSPENLSDYLRTVDNNIQEGEKVDPEAGLHYRDGDDMQDMTIEERTLKLSVMLAERHRGDVAVRDAAVEALGKTIGNIRKAMAAQHTYDFNTVRSLGAVADILISSGTFLPEGPGEVKRLYGIMKRGIGHAYTDKDGVEHAVQSEKDYNAAVESLMDLFVSNQLKLSGKFLDEVMKIRGSKVNARGVEVMGELDAEGQLMVRGMKGYMNMDIQAIRDRIEALDDIIANGSEAASMNAAAEKMGIELAEQYVAEVSDRAAQEKVMRDQLRDMTSQWDPKMSGEARKAYSEQKRALRESIRKIRIERADAMRQLASQVGNQLRNSIERVKAFREREKQRIEEIWHNANSDMQGRPYDEHGMKKKGLAVKLSNNMASRLLLAPAATFEQMMRVFGSKSVDGEGYLFDRYVRGWQECRDKEFTSTQEVEGILDKKAAEILGKRKARWSDLYALTRKGAASCDWQDGGEMREHKVTQGNLMYVYMVDKMTDGQVKLRRMGITEDKVREIEQVLDPKLKAVADWLQEELLPNLRNRYNEVHVRMFGAPMAEIENYFPLRILANARLEEVEMSGKIDGKDLPKTMTGAIIKRRFNNYALDVLNSDAVSIALDHIREMETWAAFAEYRRDLCTLLSYKHFRNQVKNMTTIYGSGERLWDKFYNLSLLVGGAYQPKTSEFDKVAVNITKLATGACIAIRLNTALKQLLSYPAFAPDANLARLMYNVTPWRARACWKWAMENMPAFQRRWKSRLAGNDVLRPWKHDWDWTKAEFVQKVQRAGITPNAFIDALTVAMGSEAVYHSKLKGYLKDGFSKEYAHRRAVQDAEIIFNLSQQSSELPYLSLLQNDRSYLSTSVTNFRSSPMSYLRQSIQSKRELANMVKSKEIQIEFETKKAVREGLTPEQAQARAKRKYKHNWVRNLFKSMNFDYILPALWVFGLGGIWYCIFGKDDEKKKQYAEDAMKRGLLGGFEGLTFGGTVPDFVYGLATGDKPQLDEETSPAMGLITDMANLYSNGKTERAANEMINTMIALGVGVNPQVLEDGVVAGMDFFEQDEKSARDWALLFMRVIQCPQSQMDQVYFDELGMDAKEAQRMSPAQLAERYATYKARRANFATMWRYDDERWEMEVKEPWRKRFEKEAKERLKGWSEERVNTSLEKYDAEWSATSKRLEGVKQQPMELTEKAAKFNEVVESPEGQRYLLYKPCHAMLDKMIESWLEAPSAEAAATEAAAIIEFKAKVVEMLDSWEDEKKARQLRQEVFQINKEWHKRHLPPKAGQAANQ